MAPPSQELEPPTNPGRFIDAAIARLTAYRATLDADAVVKSATGLTARDLDLLLDQLGTPDYPTPAPWRPGMPATD